MSEAKAVSRGDQQNFSQLPPHEKGPLDPNAILKEKQDNLSAQSILDQLTPEKIAELEALAMSKGDSIDQEITPERAAELEVQIAKNMDKVAEIFGVDVSLLSSAVIPSSPDSPVLPPSKESTLSSSASQNILANPWLQPSFLAGFTAIMSLLAESMSENKKLQADFMATANSQILEMAVETAFLTKGLYAQRSADLYTQAASAAAGAVISGVQLGFEIRNIAQASNSQAVQHIENQIADKKQELENSRGGVNATIPNPNPLRKSIDDKQSRINTIDQDLKNGVPSASSSSSTPPPKLSAQQIRDLNTEKQGLEQDISQLEKDLGREQGQIENKIKELEIDKDRTIGQDRSLGEARIRTVSEIISSIKETLAASIRGGIQGKEGEIQAKKDIQEGLRSLTQSFQQSVTNNRDTVKQELSQLFDFIMRIVEAEYRSHSIRQG